MISIYKKLGLTEEAYANKIKEMYESGKSHKEISLEFGCHFDVISRACKKYDISIRTESERFKVRVKHAKLSDEEKQILDGIMLADGHIEKGKIAARMTYGSKFLQTLEDIKDVLPSLEFSNLWQSEKTYCWHFKSRFYSELLTERKRWYPNDLKIVPNDVYITPLSCYWWFVGDGFATDYGVILCTDSFEKEHKDILVYKLQEQGFNSHITPNNGRIRIKGKSAPYFLHWIKSNVEISSQYIYKWENGKRMRK